MFLWPKKKLVPPQEYVQKHQVESEEKPPKIVLAKILQNIGKIILFFMQ